METKIVFVLIDGFGDRGLVDHEFQTPMKFLKLPFFNLIARYGRCGLYDPVQAGLAPGSDTAHMSIFEYSPLKFYRGRGSFESMGAGLPMEDGDIAFKSNFSCWNPETNIVEDRRADRHFEELGPILCEYLTENIKLKGINSWKFPDGSTNPNLSDLYSVDIKYATEHRCGVRVRGPNLSDYITGTDPLVDMKPLIHCESAPLPKVGTPAAEAIKDRKQEEENARFTAFLTNELSKEIHELLEKHPINDERVKQGKKKANIVLLRGCGVRIQVPTFQQKHPELGKPFMIAPTAIIKGIGMTFGMPILEVKGATGDYFTNVEAKREAAVKAITSGEYGFGFLHIKGVDDAGHDGNLKIRSELLLKINTMLGNLIEDLQNDQKKNGGKVNYSLVLTGDHTTPLVYGDHCHDPVPFAMINLNDIPFSVSGKTKEEIANETYKFGPKDYKYDHVVHFDDISNAAGCLGRFPGSELMTLMKQEKVVYSKQ